MCVDVLGQTGGGALERVQIFILAEGQKQKLEFLALSGRESSLVQTFCESCVHLDINYPFIHLHDSEICDSRLSYLKVHCQFHYCPFSVHLVLQSNNLQYLYYKNLQ